MAPVAVSTLASLRSSTSRRRGAVLTVLVLALLVRVAAAWTWHQSAVESGRLFRLGDSDSYWVLAGHLARGEAYEYGSPDASIFRAPLYPLALAPFTLIGHPPYGVLCARLLGCFCGTWVCWLVMNWTRRVAGETAAVFSGLIAAFYPGAVGMSIVILSEAIFCPLMLLTLIFWHSAMNSQRLGSILSLGATAGACSGLAILARPSWLLFMPLASAVVLLGHNQKAKQIRVLFAMAVSCIAIMSPWWFRNYLVTSRFVPTTLQVGASLYDGLHEGASGASDENMEFVAPFIEQQRHEDLDNPALTSDPQHRSTGQAAQENLRNFSTFEYRLNARIQASAVEWAKKNVSVVIRLSMIKFSRTWSVWPAAGEVGSTPLRALLLVSCFGVLFCSAWTALCMRNLDRWLILLCWMPAGYFTLLHMVFVGSIRYREPAMLVLTVLAGIAIWQIPWIQRQFVRRETWKSSIVPNTGSDPIPPNR